MNLEEAIFFVEKRHLKIPNIKWHVVHFNHSYCIYTDHDLKKYNMSSVYSTHDINLFKHDIQEAKTEVNWKNMSEKYLELSEFCKQQIK